MCMVCINVYIYMCVYGVHMCVCAPVCADEFAPVCAYWAFECGGLRVVLGTSFHHFQLSLRGRVSPSDPELTNTANLPSQFTLGIPGPAF